jgi:hypothetical protein
VATVAHHRVDVRQKCQLRYMAVNHDVLGNRAAQRVALQS